MRELLKHHREQRQPSAFDAAKDLDELSKRRRGGTDPAGRIE
jgi:hypothetical protein